jgi:hypothetical protein
MMDLVKSDDDGEKIKRRRTKGFSGFEIWKLEMKRPRTRIEEKLFQLVSRPCCNRRQIQNRTSHNQNSSVCPRRKG